jgi:type IV pilus assembly protein PilO
MLKFDLRSPAVQKILLSILLGGGLTAVYFFTHLLPFTYPNMHKRITELKTEKDNKANELSRARAIVADLPRFEAEYEQLHERWAQAAELLPTERQLPVLMRRISLAAQQNGVGFTMFRPAGARNEQHYTETPIQISVFGDYHQIGSFLADLANMRRIVTVAHVQLKTNANIRDVSASTVAEFTASSYHLTTTRTTPEPPAKGSAAPGEENNAKEGQGNGTES